MFIGINRDVAFARRLDDWNDLFFEASCFNRCCCTPMRFDGKCILLFTRQILFFGQIFRSDPHMPSTKGIGESRDHQIDHLRIAHPLTESEVRRHVATF